MTGKTHVACGTSLMIYLTITHLQSIELLGQSYIPAIGLATVAIGSLAPDIDLPQSSMGQKHKFISRLLTHRGITHTLLVPAILTALMYYLNKVGIPVLPSLVLGFNIGWLAHIVADLFNRKGVPLLWPIYGKKIHIATVKTKNAREPSIKTDWQEPMFLILWLGGLIACLIYFR